MLLLAACDGNTDPDNCTGSTGSAESVSAPAANGAASASGSPEAEADTGSCESGSLTDSDDPCVIATAAQLQGISAEPEGHYVLESDLDAAETADWNDGAGFEPIQNFRGTFDGHDHTISGLHISRPDLRFTGLFGFMNGDAQIRNLHLTDADIHGGTHVGIAVGQIRGSVDNVHVAGTVSAEEGFAGGLAGSLTGGSLRGSSARAAVTGEENVGGLVGKTDPATVVSDSWSNSEVTGSTRVGGLTGSHGGSELSRSYSISTVTATHDDPFAGGIAGELNPEA
ncbi:MAG TPA: ZmpA/ZmpB/ZmpC family metallo-endopeptidase-related protein, partial [Deinococcales bacterium]|nr:ZmpA/ZmpB/ZmpC family metallo-endopeptidase-related protein [Deinococcales bacterium]